MVQIENYNIEIVRRTKEILESSYPDFENNDREVTFLMNCLLGLIIAVSENEKRERKVFKGKIDEEFLSLIPEKVGFIESIDVRKDITKSDLSEISISIKHKESLASKDIFWFVNKIRNGIAHQNIQGISENGNWSGVRIWNLNYNRKDFEIIFQIEELKQFAIKIAKRYLDSHNV